IVQRNRQGAGNARDTQEVRRAWPRADRQHARSACGGHEERNARMGQGDQGCRHQARQLGWRPAHRFGQGEEFMDAMERRVFLKGASMGLLAFTVGGSEFLMTSGEARARAVPFRLLNAEEAETLEAMGEALVPGAREAGIAHFIDHQISVPPGEALLEARIVNIKPPFANFYRAAIGGVDKASSV